MDSIEEWLGSGEEISYDSSEYALEVDGEKAFRAVVTNKRAIFHTENRIHEIQNSHVDAMSFARRIFLGLLIGGIIAFVIGGFFQFEGNDPLIGRWVGSSSVNYTAIALFVLGAILILIFIFYRPETLKIYAGSRIMYIRGSRNILKSIVKEIRKTKT